MGCLATFSYYQQIDFYIHLCILYSDVENQCNINVENS